MKLDQPDWRHAAEQEINTLAMRDSFRKSVEVGGPVAKEPKMHFAQCISPNAFRPSLPKTEI